MLDGVLESQEAPLGCQWSRTSYSFGLETAFAICFLLRGLSRPPQGPPIPFFFSTQGWALAQGQQEDEEGVEADLLGA